MERLDSAIQVAGVAMEAAGVAVIVIGFIVATLRYLFGLRTIGLNQSYATYRAGLARAILLGLELLVAGDIIRTVVIAPSLENLAILGGIVLIRTFLSLTLEVEATGHFPWQRPSSNKSDGERPV